MSTLQVKNGKGERKGKLYPTSGKVRRICLTKPEKKIKGYPRGDVNAELSDELLAN